MPSTDKVSAQPVSLCALGAEATIRRVTFAYNDTGGDPSLSGLQVLDVSPLSYRSDDEKPLWAVEKVSSNWTAEEISLLWGLVSDEASVKFADGISTLRSEALPLPVFIDSSYSGSGWGDGMVRTA